MSQTCWDGGVGFLTVADGQPCPRGYAPFSTGSGGVQIGNPTGGTPGAATPAGAAVNSGISANLLPGFPALSQFIKDNAPLLKAGGLLVVGAFVITMGIVLLLGAEIAGVKNAAI